MARWSLFSTKSFIGGSSDLSTEAQNSWLNGSLFSRLAISTTLLAKLGPSYLSISFNSFFGGNPNLSFFSRRRRTGSGNSLYLRGGSFAPSRAEGRSLAISTSVCGKSGQRPAASAIRFFSWEVKNGVRYSSTYFLTFSDFLSDSN